MELDDFLKETTEKISDLVRFETEKNMMDVIINIFMGSFKDYKEYYDYWVSQEKKYQESYNKILEENTIYNFRVPIKPAPLLSERLFYYIRNFGGRVK